MTLLHEHALESSGSTLQFCPAPDLEHCLAVGSYQLDEATQTRSGAIYLWSLQALSQEPRTLPLLSTRSVAGVFDLKWSELPDHPLLAAGLSNGSVVCSSLGPGSDAGQPELCTASQAQCFDGAMCCCIDFLPGDRSCGMAVSSSDGKLGMLAQVSSSSRNRAGCRAPADGGCSGRP